MVEALLTTEDVAKLLSISKKSVLALVRSGEIAFIPVGAGKVRPRLRFERRDIEDFIRRNKRVCVSLTPASSTSSNKGDERNASAPENETFQQLRSRRQHEREIRKQRRQIAR